MEDNSRMKEITGNLRQDVKELLGESANLVSSFIKRGLCTVRAVADKWKAFAHDISDAVDTLMQPPFADNGPEAPAQALDPAAEPVVTVMESADDRFTVGQRMPLSQANSLIIGADYEQRERGQPPNPITVKIDYMMDGQTDCYWLPLEIGAGGGLLRQMKNHLDRCLGPSGQTQADSLFNDIPEQYREQLRSTFSPTFEDSLYQLSNRVLSYFQRHCDIAEMELTTERQAAALPEQKRQGVLAAAKLAAVTLRKAANMGVDQPAAEQEKQQPAPVPPAAKAEHRPAEHARPSIKMKLTAIKAGQKKRAAPKRHSPTPQR